MRPDPTILAFDTSAAHCAAALLSGDRIMASEIRPMAKGQAETLMPMLDQMLSSAGFVWADLTTIGVGVGPGNFTGIRISVAAARGLALGLGIPAVGVSTLEALAEGFDEPCIAVSDARRGAVYAQGFNGVPLPAQHLDPEALERLTQTHPNMPIIATHPMDFPTHTPALPLPNAIAAIASKRAGSTLPPPAPLYLREADATPAKPAPMLISE